MNSAFWTGGSLRSERVITKTLCRHFTRRPRSYIIRKSTKTQAIAWVFVIRGVFT